jgi:hypothetical protein
MDTDSLVAMLARGAGPVAPGAAGRRFAVALAVGGAVAATLVATWMGIRPDLREATRDPMFWVKLGVPTAMLVAALAASVRAGRPGATVGTPAVTLLLPVAAIWLLAAFALASAPPGSRVDLIVGTSWAACIVSISVLAFPTFVGTLWAMRGLAPTRPALAGALSGLVAGAAGALVYALHCPEMAAPFIAIWYVLGMALPAAVGALAGHAMLRW